MNRTQVYPVFWSDLSRESNPEFLFCFFTAVFILARKLVGDLYYFLRYSIKLLVFIY